MNKTQIFNHRSLFSFELVVDKLKINCVSCLFPVVAFRLLDFPTLMIPHVEDTLAEKLCKSIAKDSDIKLPTQFEELKDKNGYFSFIKGKSTLFKISLLQLDTHLKQTPLYIMILDNFMNKNSLVANCLVPLNELFKDLQQEILKLGLSVPCMKSLQGTFKLFNLMGKEIGEIFLVFRLSSLGYTLLSHMNDNTVHNVKDFPNKISNFHVENEINTIMPKSLICKAEKEESAQTEIFIPEVKNHWTQSENYEPNLLSKKDAFVQTGKLNNKAKKFENPTYDSIVDNDELFVSNIVCPPPLFFNNKFEDEICKNEGRPLFDCIPAWVDISNSDSDTDTIREEDRYSDIDDKEFKSISLKKELVTVVNTYKRENKIKPENHEQFKKFPILRELVKELMEFTNNKDSNQPFDFVRQESHSKIIKKPEKIEDKNAIIERLTKPKYNVSIHDVVSKSKRISRPCKDENLNKTDIGKKHSRSNQNQIATKKSRKSILEYGMTHTQRLRLNKTNKTLLSAMDIEERRRLEQFHMNFKKTVAIEPKLGKQRKQSLPVTTPRKTSITNGKMYRKPVPTPRHSVVGKSVETVSGSNIEELKIKIPEINLSKLGQSSSISSEYQSAYSHNSDNSDEFGSENFNNSDQQLYESISETNNESEKMLGNTRILKPVISFEAVDVVDDDDDSYSDPNPVLESEKTLEPLKSSISPMVEDRSERILPPTRNAVYVGNTSSSTHSTPSPNVLKYRKSSKAKENFQDENPVSIRQKSNLSSRKASIHTESVSSYSPSDADEIEKLQDLGEDDEDSSSSPISFNVKQMSELRPSDQAKSKLGYTCKV